MVNNPLIRTYFLGKHGRRGLPLNFHEYSFFRNRQSEVENFTKIRKMQSSSCFCMVTICNSHMLLFQQWKTVAQRAQLHPRSSMEACMMILNYAEMMPKRQCRRLLLLDAWLKSFYICEGTYLFVIWSIAGMPNFFPYNLIQSFKTSTLLQFVISCFHTAIWVLQSSNFLLVSG